MPCAQHAVRLVLAIAAAGAAAPRCSIGPGAPAAELVLDCADSRACLATGLEQAKAGVRCGSVWIGSRGLLTAAAYLATPETRVEGPGAEAGWPLLDGRFDAAFLAVSLPPQPFAAQLGDVALVVQSPRRPSSRHREGPQAELRAGDCQNCKAVADNTESILEGLWSKYHFVLPTASQGVSALQANDSATLHRADRLLVTALSNPDVRVKKRFGVAVDDLDGWHAILATAAGASFKTVWIHCEPIFYGAPVPLGERGRWTLDLATPYGADFVMLPAGVLGSAGLQPSQGLWDHDGDLKLLEAVGQALRSGGKVFAVVEVGEACLVIGDPKQGGTRRIYGRSNRARLMRNWYLIRKFKPLVRSHGPCHSEPQVLVLGQRWEQHPASLLTIRRLDIIPKLLYASHGWGLARAPITAHGGAGEWSRELYLHAAGRMGSVVEDCKLDELLGAEPCIRKKGPAQFVHRFDHLLSNMEVHGFSRGISVIKLDVEGQMLIGAHRIAAALALGVQRVPVQPANMANDIDQSSLLGTLAPADSVSLIMELARALQHPMATKQLHVVLLWPSWAALGWGPSVLNHFNLIGHLFMAGWEVHFRGHHCSNLVRWLYMGQRKAGRAGALCGHETGLVFSLETSVERRSIVRKVAGVLEHHSGLGEDMFHVTQGPGEVEFALAGLLHPPTAAFLSAANDSRREWLPPAVLLQRLPPGASAHCVLAGASVMRAHGLGSQPAGLELVCDGKVKLPDQPGITDHGREPWLGMHGVAHPSDLVHEPSRYFLLAGWRFMAPRQLVAFKRARHAALCQEAACEFAEDLQDIAALEALYGEPLG